MRKIAAALIFSVLFPCAVTLAFTSRASGEVSVPVRGKQVILDRGAQSTVMDLEEYLIGLLAAQIPADGEKEALKAQAILARTAVYGRMNGEDAAAESALDMDYREPAFLTEKEASRYREAVRATRGLVIRYEGDLIEPLFHRTSAGKTRSGGSGYPYLEPAEEPEAQREDSYLFVKLYTERELADAFKKLRNPPDVSPQELLDSLQAAERDDSGYVLRFQAGGRLYTGDEIRYALHLPSSAFYFKRTEDRIRCLCFGQGHGFGLSQTGAERLSRDGFAAEEILHYYFKNVTVSE